MRVILYHGLEGNPQGPKARALAELFPNLEVPDFQDMELKERLYKAAVDLLEGGEPALLIGSSLGGLMAAIIADKFPQNVLGYVLLAPALHMEVAQGIKSAPVNASILLGTLDDPALNDAAKAFAAKHGIFVYEKEDGHRLADSLEDIQKLAQAAYEAVSLASAA